MLAKNGCPQLLAECGAVARVPSGHSGCRALVEMVRPAGCRCRAFTRFGYASAGLAEAVVRDTSTDQSEIEASQGRAVSQAIQLFFSSYGQSGGPPRTVISMAGQCCGVLARWDSRSPRARLDGKPKQPGGALRAAA